MILISPFDMAHKGSIGTLATKIAAFILGINERWAGTDCIDNDTICVVANMPFLTSYGRIGLPMNSVKHLTNEVCSKGPRKTS